MDSFGPVVGIDRGASFTDFGVVHNGRLSETRSLKGRDWEPIIDVYRQLKDDHKATDGVFTGSSEGMPAGLAQEVEIIPEINAVGFGGATLAGLSDCIVASIGTGTAIVHFKDNHVSHVGGTGVGGGTIRGLGSLLCGTEDPAKIEELALKGNAARMNLTISDLGYKAVSFLGADVTASNFAAVDSRRKEDLAAGILSLVGETVGILTSLCAREAGCPQAIVLVGKVAANRFIQNTVSLVAKLYQTNYTFPENPSSATVYGAIMQLKHDRIKAGI